MTARIKNPSIEVMQNAVGATANGAIVGCIGMSTLGVQITGTFSATVTFEGTVDNTNWVSLQAANTATGAVATTATAAGVYVMSVAGLRHARARVSTYVSGSVTATGIMAPSGGPAVIADIDVAGTENVAITSQVPGTAATNLGKAEDAVHASSDTGVMSLAVRNDAIAALAGTDGDYAPLQVDASGRLYVASDTDIFTIAQTPTITAGAYSANDAIGGLLTFADAAKISGGDCTIRSITIKDDAKQDGEIDIVFFDRTFTATGNNDAFDPSDADLANYVGHIKIRTSDYVDFVDNSVATRDNLGLSMTLNGTSLFAQAVIRTVETYAATDDITIKVVVERH